MLFYDANWGREIVYCGSETQAKGLAYNGGCPVRLEKLGRETIELRSAPAHWEEEGRLFEAELAAALKASKAAYELEQANMEEGGGW